MRHTYAIESGLKKNAWVVSARPGGGHHTGGTPISPRVPGIPMKGRLVERLGSTSEYREGASLGMMVQKVCRTKKTQRYDMNDGESLRQTSERPTQAG